MWWARRPKTSEAGINSWTHSKNGTAFHLGHVQTHYFPKGWSQRVHSYWLFDRLEVSLVDVYDVFLSKLFSARNKDMDDLVVLAPQIDKAMLAERFENTCQDFVTIPRLKELATKNWRVVFGDDLPEPTSP